MCFCTLRMNLGVRCSLPSLLAIRRNNGGIAKFMLARGFSQEKNWGYGQGRRFDGDARNRTYLRNPENSASVEREDRERKDMERLVNDPYLSDELSKAELDAVIEMVKADQEEFRRLGAEAELDDVPYSSPYESMQILFTPDEELDQWDLEFKKAVLGGLSKRQVDSVTKPKETEPLEYIPNLKYAPTPKPPLPEQRKTKVDKLGRYFGVGGRKRSRALAWLTPAKEIGEGHVRINGKDMADYFSSMLARYEVCSSMILTRCMGLYDVRVVAKGGGLTGQQDAIKLAIAKALINAHPEDEPLLKKHMILFRDPRVKERMKPGQKKARKSEQWVKR